MIGPIEPQIGQAAQQRRNCDLAFDASELGAKAEMDAAAERQGVDARPGDVEAVRLEIDRWIPVRRTEQAQDRFTFRIAVPPTSTSSSAVRPVPWTEES